MIRVLPILATLLLRAAAAPAPVAQERYVISILPSLDYGPACWSTVALSNLGDRAVTVEIEAHREGGGLTGLEGLGQTVLHLDPGQKVSHRIEPADEAGVGWLKIRELIPSPKLSPVVAVSGLSECTDNNQLRSTSRQLSYPTRNPWFAGDVEEIPGNVISLVNTSEHAAQASLCYSQGNLYSAPSEGSKPAELKQICSSAFDVLIPPYASQQFPVQRGDSTHFAIKTLGDAIVLQMLRPVTSGVKIYSVDSSVTFGGEFTGK